MIQGVFWLVIPKKLKYEKILKYGTGHLEKFLNDTPNYSKSKRYSMEIVWHFQ